jgi:hypothetical protein
MNTFTVGDELRACAEWIKDKELIKGEMFAHDDMRRIIGACMLGVIQKSTGLNYDLKINNFIRTYIKGMRIPSFNDNVLFSKAGNASTDQRFFNFLADEWEDKQ